MMSNKQLTVFLSYSHRDKNLAKSLAKELRKVGLRVWIDEGELRTGDSIITTIAKVIAEVEFVVALISKHSISSEWCTKELSLAVSSGLAEGRVRVLPLKVDDVEMPSSLSDTFYLQLRSNNPRRILNRLIKDVQSHHHDLLTRENDRFRYKLVPPSQNSSIDAATKRRFKAALLSPRLEQMKLGSATWDAVRAAENGLVNDYSVPAMDFLFECAVEDHRKSWVAGYATAGLIRLIPASTPWLRRLLEHRSRRVMVETLHLLTVYDEVLSEVPSIFVFPLRSVSRQVFIEIKREGNWSEFKSKLVSRLQKEETAKTKRYDENKKHKNIELFAKVKGILEEVDAPLKLEL